MNQYRCETCKYFEETIGTLQLGYCNKDGKRITHYLYLQDTMTIDRFGCASHSDFQSERDKLDELENWLDEQVPRMDLEHPFYECKTRTKKKIAELRQEKK
jgi:hypothetical protein